MTTAISQRIALNGVCLLLLVSSSILIGGAPVPGDLPPLLVVGGRTGKPEIFLINADGTGSPRNLTNSKSVNTYPAWSPDHGHIAFVSDRDGNYQIYVMEADGSHVKQLTRGEQINRAPAWSPDGKKIAFCRHTLEGPRIFTMDADGANPTQLNEGSGWDPAWSPDGKKILFASSRGGNGFHVCITDADGTHYTELTTNNNPVGFVYPAWSPDGTQIAWGDTVGETTAGASMEIFVANADGTHAKQITALGHMNAYPSWSPDGSKLTFFHYESEQSGIYYTVGSQGGTPQELLKEEAPIEGGRPAWRSR